MSAYHPIQRSIAGQRTTSVPRASAGRVRHAPSAVRFIVFRAITRHSIHGEASEFVRRLPGSSGREQLAQHVLQNPAVLEVVELVHGIDTAKERDAFEAAVGGDDLGEHALARLYLAVQAADRDLLVA